MLPLATIHWRSSCAASSSIFNSARLFNYCHPGMYAMVFHCEFEFSLPWKLMSLTFFMCSLNISIFLFYGAYSKFCPFFCCIVRIFSYGFERIVYIYCTIIFFINYMHYKHFLLWLFSFLVFSLHTNSYFNIE